MGKYLIVIIFIIFNLQAFSQTCSKKFFEAERDTSYNTYATNFITKNAINVCPARTTIEWRNCNPPRRAFILYTIKLSCSGEILNVNTYRPTIQCFDDK